MANAVHDLMGAAEIGARLNVSRQRVQQIVARPDFPKPAKELAMGKVWLTSEVEAWISRNRDGGTVPRRTRRMRRTDA
jgi:predicted DNA-binding transcriptional regulator AlpA